MSDRIASLLAEVAALREVEMRKCEPSAEPSPCALRAKKVYALAVVIAGGPSAVAATEDVTESAVRRRVENPRLAVHLAHVLAMPAESIEHVAEELKRAASEKRSMRRAS
jgi:hypothetical protein